MSVEIEMKVKSVFESQSKTGTYVLLLENIDENDKQQIPIIIGEKEAHAIYCALYDIPNARPLSHDIMTSAIQFLNGNISKVLVYKVDQGIYYSYIYLNRGEQFTRIDARTSDAVALALRLDVPLYIDKQILDQENIEVVMEGDNSPSVPISKTTKILSLEELKAKLEKAIDQEDYEQASVLRDQIASFK